MLWYLKLINGIKNKLFRIFEFSYFSDSGILAAFDKELLNGE